MAHYADCQGPGILDIDNSAHRNIERQWDFVHVDDDVAVGINIS